MTEFSSDYQNTEFLEKLEQSDSTECRRYLSHMA